MGGGVAAASSENKNGRRMFIDATAGAIAGCIARFAVGPLDVVKIRFQVQLEPIANAAEVAVKRGASKYTGFGQALVTIFREEGVQGLWRGTVPGLLLSLPYTAVQFVALQQVRDTAERLGLTAQPSTAPWVSFASGALAGAAGTVASYPFDLLRTTMAAQGEPKVYRNLVDASRDIVQRRGVAGLYSGLGVTLVEIMPYAALQFGLYDVLKNSWARHSARAHQDPAAAGPTSEPSPVAPSSQAVNFVCGLLAGLCAKLATHPLDVAKKRYQVAGLQRSLQYGARIDPRFAAKSLVSSLADIYRAEGIAGLWKGSVPSVAKAAPSAAITFACYEAVLNWLLLAMEQRQQQQQQQQA
ncbi:mitochondrial substrate carrier protein [Haematococcus lacustris]